MNNLSLDALKSHLFETLEGIKNLSDPDASQCEKIGIDQAKQIVDVADSIIDIYKVQLQAVELAHKTDRSVNDCHEVSAIVTELGIADTQKLIG